MFESKKEKPKPFTKRLRNGSRLSMITLAYSVVAMLIAFLLASLVISYPDEFLALRHWMQRTRPGWLAWRLMLYAALGWGVWKIWHAPGFRPEDKASLKRMTIVSTMFLLACEYAVYIDPGVTP